MIRPIRITIENEATGETRSFSLSLTSMTIIYRALRSYGSAPRYLADYFDLR
jgi:hypothetical protein